MPIGLKPYTVSFYRYQLRSHHADPDLSPETIHEARRELVDAWKEARAALDDGFEDAWQDFYEEFLAVEREYWDGSADELYLQGDSLDVRVYQPKEDADLPSGVQAEVYEYRWSNDYSARDRFLYRQMDELFDTRTMYEQEPLDLSGLLRVPAQ